MVPSFSAADFPGQCPQGQQQFPDPHSEQGHIFKQDKDAIYK